MEQNQNERLGFFRRMFLAMTDFRLYPFVQREKASAASAYFTLIVVLITISLTLFFSNKVFEFISYSLDGYDENVPDFTFENGILDVSESIYSLDGENKFVVDTNMTNNEFANTDIGKEVLYSKYFLVINSDGIFYGTEVARPFRTTDLKLNKNELHEYLKMANEDWAIKAAIVSVMWLTTFVVYYIMKMINVLLLMFTAWIFNIIFGMKLKFANYYKIVVYAITLPLLVELVSVLYLGRVSEVAALTYQILAYIYIFYALRALKLDIIITSIPSTDIKQKIENMIQKLEDEIEDKAKKEQEKDEEENKENEEKDDKQ